MKSQVQSMDMNSELRVDKQSKYPSYCCLVAVICTVTLSLILLLILNIIFRQELYLLGINFISTYQTDVNSYFVSTIYNIISIFGNTFFIIAFLVLVHLFVKRKLSTFVYLTYIISNIYFIAFSKQAFQDPRPYYSNTVERLEWMCPSSYGYPSGHSWISVLLYEPVLTDLVPLSIYKNAVVIICIILSGVLIPISRMYLGSHSADQIVTGLYLSFTALVIYRYKLKKMITQGILSFIFDQSLRCKMLIFVFFHFMSCILSCFMYAINMDGRPIPIDYITRIKTQCSIQSLNQDFLEQQAGISSSLVGIAFGFIYGFRIAKRIIKNTKQYVNYLKGSWTFTNCKSILKFIALYIISALIFLGILAVGLPYVIENFYIRYFLSALGYTLFGISLTSFIPYFIDKFQIIQHLKIEEK